ncbi:MAG TPA: SDR family NAD(P)-dependent oxidoreductase [Nakamurella sp.]|jgi:short-subunit dehydrogenase
MRHYVFAGGTAIVTGAASGIGEALAHGLAARGSRLALLDRDTDRLDGVASAIRARYPPVEVDTLVVDLADQEATASAGRHLAAAHRQTTLLINNAGVTMAGRFDQLTLQEFGWVLDINFRAVVTLTHHLLPVLRSHPGSHLVNLSSIFGIIAPPGQTAYCASKFAVRGFTEALRSELAPDSVGVTCVHPGGIATRIATTSRAGSGVSESDAAGGRARANRILTIPPSTAATLILRGVELRRPRVLIGWTARVPDLLSRVAPTGHGTLLAKVFARSR